MNKNRNWKPETFPELKTEISIYEKYYKKYQKERDRLVKSGAGWLDYDYASAQLTNIQRKLRKHYLAILELTSKSNKGKINIVYQSTMN
jgi:hypothetical protein